MSNTPTFEEAIKLLKNAVKYSTIENQKHIDLSVVIASQRLAYQKALVTVQASVKKGEHTQAQVNELLGL